MRPAAVLVDIGGHLCSFLHAFLHQMHNIKWTICGPGDDGLNTSEHVCRSVHVHAFVCACVHACAYSEPL